MKRIEDLYESAGRLERALARLLADFAPPPVVAVVDGSVTLILRAEEETTSRAEALAHARSWRRWRVEVRCARSRYKPQQPALLQPAGRVVSHQGVSEECDWTEGEIVVEHDGDGGHRHLLRRDEPLSVPLDAAQLAGELQWMRSTRRRDPTGWGDTDDWNRFVHGRFWAHRSAEFVDLRNRLTHSSRKIFRRQLLAAHPWLGKAATWQDQRNEIRVQVGPSKVAIELALHDQRLRAPEPYAYWLADDLATYATWPYAWEVQAEVIDADAQRRSSGELTYV